MAHKSVSVVKPVMHGLGRPCQCEATRALCKEYFTGVWMRRGGGEEEKREEGSLQDQNRPNVTGMMLASLNNIKMK